MRCTSLEIGGAKLSPCNVPMPYADALELCKARGETLARIEDEAQARTVAEHARTTRDDKWWLGVDDRADEGKFRWQAPGSSSFVYWDRGEPDNAGCNRDCAVIDDDEDGR